MMQRLKNYRERLGYSHVTANEREGAERRGGETKEQREDRLQQMREMQHERRGAETEEQREDRLQQMSLHSTAAQSVHHAFPSAPPRLNAYLWLPTLLSQARPTNVLHFTSYNRRTDLQTCVGGARMHFMRACMRRRADTDVQHNNSF